jgi:LysR family hydrogen peroxide-inducible transcriptional activator
MITLRQIGFFVAVAVAVADALSFSRAAEACFVTQPALSAGIKELEDRLGAQLVERTRRSVLLTPLGKEIAARGRRLLLDAEEIETLARAHRNPEEGDLRLGAIPTIGPYLIPRALPAIRARFPGLRLYLREELTESLIDGLNEGRLDALLIALPFETGALRILPLFDDGYQLASPPDWPPQGATGGHALPTDGHLMLLDKGHCLQRHALEAYPGRVLPRDEDFAATSLSTLIAMVSEGLGITLLPELAIDAGVVTEGQVRLTPLPDACPRHVVLAWRPNSAREAVFEEIGSLLRQARDRTPPVEDR